MDLVNAMLSFAESLNLMLCMARFRPEGLLCSARVRVGTSDSSRPGIVWARLPLFEFGFGIKFHGTLNPTQMRPWTSRCVYPTTEEFQSDWNALMRCLVAVLRNPADLADFIGVLVGAAFGARAAQLPMALARALQRWQRVDGYLARLGSTFGFGESHPSDSQGGGELDYSASSKRLRPAWTGCPIPT